ncbi:MAG: FliM/FliN family flagellar motor switch protein [Phycisphaerales bacterium]|nr:FliM/FliN family flagellar motor switch protein [Phycisphaerales bacterium]
MPSTSDSILKLEVPIVVRIGEREMKLHEVLALTAGAIVEVPKLADAELDLMVNNQVIGHGTAVKVGEKFGILVTFVGTPAERAAALAAGQNQAEPESDGDAAAEDLAAQLLAGQV